ncbi:hypothetical protein, partial [Caldimonas manganoxidans]
MDQAQAAAARQAARALFGVPIEQDRRLLRLHAQALPGVAPAGLVAQRVRIEEGLSQPFHIDIEALSPAAGL